MPQNHHYCTVKKAGTQKQPNCAHCWENGEVHCGKFIQWHVNQQPQWCSQPQANSKDRLSNATWRGTKNSQIVEAARVPLYEFRVTKMRRHFGEMYIRDTIIFKKREDSGVWLTLGRGAQKVGWGRSTLRCELLWKFCLPWWYLFWGFGYLFY